MSQIQINNLHGIIESFSKIYLQKKNELDVWE